MGHVVVDELIVGQPFNGPALGADITEFVPRWQEVRILLLELVPESAKGTVALNCP